MPSTEKTTKKKEKNQRRRISVNILTEWTKWNKYKLAHTHWPKVEGGADRVVRARVCLKTWLFCSWRFLIALSYICARYNLNGILLFCYNQVILIWSLDFYIQNSSHSTKTAEKKFGSIMDPIYIGWHWKSDARAKKRRPEMKQKKKPEQRTHTRIETHNRIHTANGQMSFIFRIQPNIICLFVQGSPGRAIRVFITTSFFSLLLSFIMFSFVLKTWTNLKYCLKVRIWRIVLCWQMNCPFWHKWKMNTFFAEKRNQARAHTDPHDKVCLCVRGKLKWKVNRDIEREIAFKACFRPR